MSADSLAKDLRTGGLVSQLYGPTSSLGVWLMSRNPDHFAQKTVLTELKAAEDCIAARSDYADPDEVADRRHFRPLITGFQKIAEALETWVPGERDQFAQVAPLVNAASAHFDEAFRPHSQAAGKSAHRDLQPAAKLFAAAWPGGPTTLGDWIALDLLHRWGKHRLLERAHPVGTVATPVLVAPEHSTGNGCVLLLTVTLFEQSLGTGAIVPDLCSLGMTHFPADNSLIDSVARLWRWTGLGQRYTARWSLERFARIEHQEQQLSEEGQTPTVDTQPDFVWPGSLAGPSFEAAFLCALLALTDPENKGGAVQQFSREAAVTARVQWPGADPEPLSRDELLKLQLAPIAGIEEKCMAAERCGVQVYVAREQNPKGRGVSLSNVNEALYALLKTWRRLYDQSIQIAWEKRWINRSGNWQPPAAPESATTAEHAGDVAPGSA